MPLVPHLRLTMSGTLPSNEMFSCNLSLVPDDALWPQALEQTLDLALLTDYLEDDGDLFTDVVTDVSAFWARATSHICSRAKLTRVKLASIGSDGKYNAAPAEAAVNVDGGSSADPIPHQIARKITLMTNGDLGRVKGGFYLPGVTASGFEVTTGLFTAAVTENVRDSVKQLIDDLENAPGIDGKSLKAVVASGGRHNDDGSVRRPPTNHDVIGVSVGRRPDVQRRRANKIAEARVATVLLADD